jgi:hypothetical protein
MNQLNYEISRLRQQELERKLSRFVAPNRETPDRIEIRLAADRDAAALHRLAELEGAELRPGGWLVALADGSLTAALRLDDGTVLADPFARTVALRRLLQLWAAQLTRGRRKRWLPALS